MIHRQIKIVAILGLVLVSCEPEKEIVDVDPNLLTAPQTSLFDVVGDWTMTSLNDETKPEFSSNCVELPKQCQSFPKKRTMMGN